MMESATDSGRPAGLSNVSKKWWITVAAVVVAVVVAANVVPAVLKDDPVGDLDTSALPKQLTCADVPFDEELLSDQPTLSRTPNPLVRSRSGTVELLADNRMSVALDFSQQLPPSDSQFALDDTLIAIYLDSSGEHFLYLSYGDGKGWTMYQNEPGQPDSSSSGMQVDEPLNVTEGPRSMLIVLELADIPWLPDRLDPSVSIDSSVTRGSTVDTILSYPQQMCT